MEIEPGLHNLRALLETVRLASEELRQDAEQQRNSGPRGGTATLPRIRPNAVAYANQQTTSLSNPNETTSTSTPRRTEEGSSPPSGSTVRRRLTDFLIRTGGSGIVPSSRGGGEGEGDRGGGGGGGGATANPRIQRPLPTTPTVPRGDSLQNRSSHHFPILQIVLNDMNQESADSSGGAPPPPPSPPGDMDLRTFGGIPLRFLGRQNAVDRRTPPDSEGEDSNGGAENNNGREAESGEGRSSSQHPDIPSGGLWQRPQYQHNPFRHWINLPPLPFINPYEREPEHMMYMNQPYFSQYVAAPRNIAGTWITHLNTLHFYTQVFKSKLKDTFITTKHHLLTSLCSLYSGEVQCILINLKLVCVIIHRFLTIDADSRH